MALTSTPLGQATTHAMIQQTAVGLTADVDLRHGSTNLEVVDITEGSGTGVASVKLYNNDGDGISVGSTAPDVVLPVVSNGTQVWLISPPLNFNNGLTMAAAKEHGVTATNAPDASTSVLLITS